MAVDVLELKQENVSRRELDSISRSGLLTASIVMVVVVSGLPVLFVAAVAACMNLPAILHLSDSSCAHLLRYLYLFSLGAVIPPAAFLMTLHLISTNMAKLGARFVITAHEFYWQASHPLTRLLLVISREPVASVPWSSVVAITGGEIPEFLQKEYGLEPDKEEEIESVPGSKSGTLKRHLYLGRYGFINFVGRDKMGRLNVLASVYADGLPAEAKLNLLEMIKLNKQVLVTQMVIEELLGTSVAKRDLQFTEIWLDVMQDRSKSFGGNLEADYSLQEGRYTVIKKLATGGQANLYLAEETAEWPLPDRALAGKSVVLKEYIPFYGGADRIHSLRDFEREYLILKNLDNPSIMRVFDTFIENGRAYLVLEFVDGVSLRTMVERSGPLPSQTVMAIARQLSRTIAYLHAQSPAIIHRDITPDNILLYKDNDIKLIDFSIAVAGESDCPAEAVGKPSYMSTDQFRGLVSKRSDWYSFGATLFFLLTGRDPVPICRSSPGEFIADADPVLDEIVRLCTEFDDDVLPLTSDRQALSAQIQALLGKNANPDLASNANCLEIQK